MQSLLCKMTTRLTRPAIFFCLPNELQEKEAQKDYSMQEIYKMSVNSRLKAT